MENRNINLKLLEYEDKEAKTGLKYSRFKTSEGWMACFDNATTDELKKNIGNVVNVDIQIDDKGRSKIACFNDIIDTTFMPEVEEIKMTDRPKIDKFGNKREEIKMPHFKPPTTRIDSPIMTHRSTTMYVSYAKDIFIKLLDNNSPPDTESKVMQTAIHMVKQAKEAFE